MWLYSLRDADLRHCGEVSSAAILFFRLLLKNTERCSHTAACIIFPGRKPSMHDHTHFVSKQHTPLLSTVNDTTLLGLPSYKIVNNTMARNHEKNAYMLAARIDIGCCVLDRTLANENKSYMLTLAQTYSVSGKFRSRLACLSCTRGWRPLGTDWCM